MFSISASIISVSNLNWISSGLRVVAVPFSGLRVIGVASSGLRVVAVPPSGLRVVGVTSSGLGGVADWPSSRGFLPNVDAAGGWFAMY